jgi:hypothetical protein
MGLDYEQIDYEYIKQLARQTGQRVTDLIPLAPQNNPFYTGTPGDWALAEWFAQVWQVFSYTTKVHIRRVHYQIVSQNPPVVMPNGLPYANTEGCWNILNLASKAARYLQLVDPEAFVDRRNPEAVVYASSRTPEPEVWVTSRLWGSQLRLPDFPELPSYRVSGYEPAQAFHLELWCEKSTVNDVLVPLCQHYGMNLQTGLGELSITATLALVHRLQEAGKPARIFYVSDFDPAGQSMPVSVSRKVEYFVRTLGLSVDARVFPVILTAEQVHSYRLPRTPIKDTERRRGGFEDRYGEGAVELDALEALYPGELQNVLSQCIACYFDPTLEQRTKDMQARLERDLGLIWHQVTARFAGDIEALRAVHAELQHEFGARMSAYGEQVQALWQAMRRELDLSVPNLDSYPLPTPIFSNELADGLYDSARDYLEQIEAYKQFQSKVL